MIHLPLSQRYHPIYYQKVRFSGHGCELQLVTDPQELGRWLMDQRLLCKKLDVQIQGTVEPPFHKNRYEGHNGFTILIKQPSDIMESNIVKMVFSENRLRFQIQHLRPETTTEWSGFITRKAASLITFAINMHVVIIGPDLSGDSSWIGAYAYIVSCPFELQPDESHIQDFWGRYKYFHKDSLCRSHSENGVPINWYGQIIY